MTLDNRVYRFDPEVLDLATRVLNEIPPWCGLSPNNRYRNYLGAVGPDESPDRNDLTFEAIKYIEVNPPPPSEGFF